MAEYYETDDCYTREQIDAFAKFLDDNIGTDYDIYESASGEPDEFYIVVADLEEQQEINAIRLYERGILK